MAFRSYTFVLQGIFSMRFTFSFILIFLSLSIFAQRKHYLDLSNPQGAVRTHLDNLQSENYNDSIAALPFLTVGRNLEEAKNSAVELKRVLDGKGIYIYTDEIPKNPNYYDSSINKHKYILTEQYENIYVLKGEDGKWRYSNSSLKAIDELYSDTFRFGTGKLLDLLPKLGTKKYFGLYSYQYIAIFILALISAIVYKFFAILAERVISKTLIKTGYISDNSDKYLRLIARPTSVFIIVLL